MEKTVDSELNRKSENVERDNFENRNDVNSGAEGVKNGDESKEETEENEIISERLMNRRITLNKLPIKISAQLLLIKVGV